MLLNSYRRKFNFMKKNLSILAVILMASSLVGITSCGETEVSEQPSTEDKYAGLEGTALDVAKASDMTLAELEAASKKEMEASNYTFKVVGLTSTLAKAMTKFADQYEWIVSEDEAQLKEYIKKAISIDSLVETFNDNAHATLLKLLALQDNKHPLKKGGVGIAYRTDALIMHCKMEFTADENIVFDAILGTMSSFPENKVYRIEPTSFLNHSKYANPKYLYSVFSKGTKKLKERHLVFEELGPNGEDEISVPWFNILRYHNGKGNNSESTAYIEFVPSDFFKDLALCSQLVHGAYGALEVTTQLQGKYTIALYWFLENKKNYKEYPTATPGVFTISMDELKHQFSIPESYFVPPVYHISSFTSTTLPEELK